MGHLREVASEECFTATGRLREVTGEEYFTRMGACVAHAGAAPPGLGLGWWAAVPGPGSMDASCGVWLGLLHRSCAVRPAVASPRPCVVFGDMACQPH